MSHNKIEAQRNSVTNSMTHSSSLNWGLHPSKCSCCYYKFYSCGRYEPCLDFGYCTSIIEYCLLSVCAKLLQSCQTLCDPMDCSLPGSSAHGILQARILEWVAIPLSRACYSVSPDILLDGIQPKVSRYLYSLYTLSSSLLLKLYT